ncbi:secretin and TonB N-terminal domain-containing protein [Ramlibacter sp. USB13]|uniref:Secretin and TonB N-terminal domain-containing protein n=1 Tax=Ramlibacter cellulosilyticus TaxID=2764187 RepID=A0A923MT33_9BURK|nr:secretin and TonB N-terminal domain-containing protein [Ramlibacter cellulosilyticus]MBC5784456.1 secretin and TonB N-terminal domain-containing protein [Ramlibacter cellulosilyticus]
MSLHPGTRALVAAAVALLCAACTTPPELSEGRQLIAQGRYEEGLARLEVAARTHPRHTESYTAFVTQRDALVNAYVREGDMQRAGGNHDAAEAQYRRAQRLDPNSAVVQASLDANARARHNAQQVAQAELALRNGDLASAERITRGVLGVEPSNTRGRAVMKAINERRASADAVPPRLRSALQRPVTLDLRDAPLRSILAVMATHGDLNFVFDREVKTDQRTSIMVRDMTLDDVLKVLLLTNQLERKILNDNSILIYPATQAKQREYQELVTRSFYLSNADPKQTAAMIRALVKTRDLFVDDKLNLIIMRDTPDAVRLAEQLVATQDLGEPEVMLELEVLEVASSVAQELGLRWPEQVGFYLPDANGAIPDVVELSSRNLRAMVANPVVLLNLRKQDGTTNLLANPRIRVKNRDKAKVHIGERVPVITTTSTANVGVSSSVSYLETGLKLDVEPNIFLDDEVAIKIQLEVSNILEQLNVSGTVAYRLGTRNAATTLRLRDGETQVLAGLISSEDRRNFAKVPYAGDMPVLGRLFRSDSEQGSKSEIVLLLTPRIVRNLSRPDTVAAQFFSGTELAPGAAPLRLTPGGRVGITPDPALAAAPAAAANAPRAATGAPVPLNIVAPAQAPVGSEFTLSLMLPAADSPVNATLQLAYDPAVLNVVGVVPPPAGGAPAPDRGSLSVDVASAGIAGTPSTPTQVRFKVVATAPTNTEIGIEVANTNRPIVAPPSAQPLSIVGR